MFVNIYFAVIILIPLYGVLIWTYRCPEESILFGNRWMYKEEPEISKTAIRYTKFASMTSMIGLPFVLLSFILEIYFLRFVLILLPLVLVMGAFKIFSDDKE
ncbi:hypothetical protein [Neobacillus sp. D3-1R]|uniref:hypothetical protein n=1 Tax=Neobacillus sp. D3-1R TaxID=3445778 RepID=UPI003F9F6BFD